MRNVKKLVNGNIEVTIDTRLKYDGHKTVIVQPDTELTALDPDTMTALQKAVVQGFQYRDALESGQVRLRTGPQRRPGTRLKRKVVDVSRLQYYLCE